MHPLTRQTQGMAPQASQKSKRGSSAGASGPNPPTVATRARSPTRGSAVQRVRQRARPRFPPWMGTVANGCIDRTSHGMNGGAVHAFIPCRLVFPAAPRPLAMLRFSTFAHAIEGSRSAFFFGWSDACACVCACT
jgi:hypothetical protein